MKSDAPRRRFRRHARRVLVALGVAGSLLLAENSLDAKLETWRHDTAAAFGKAKKERVVVSDLGKVRLGRAITADGDLEAAHVWDLARTKNGALFAATGSAGKVFMRVGDGPWTVAYKADDTQVFSLVALGDGRVFAGTGGGGQVVEITGTEHRGSRPAPEVKYIWDLAADAAGNIYAATGPTGQLWKRAPDGKWSMLLDSKHPHLLCVAVAADGSVFAGSDGEGLIYKVGVNREVSVVYDASQNEVRTLSIGPDGALYAGTAAEAAGGSGAGPTRGLSMTSISAPGAVEPLSASVFLASARSTQIPANRGADRPRGPEPPGGTASPRPGPPGENAVYRIGSEGAAREIFRARALIYALAWQGDRLLVGLGPEGQIYEIRGLGRESAPIARLDHGEVLALLALPSGDVAIGAGNPGAVLRLSASYAAAGTITSEVLDTKLISRFGALTWQADRPDGTNLAVQVRTGNVSEPDATWSDWSRPQSDPKSARAIVPPGRFAQYRVNFQTERTDRTAELRSLALHYQTVNLPPEITKVTVPDLNATDGATRQTRLALRWEATDPNDDELVYTLHVRKEGWPDWVKLGDAPLTEKTYNWDTTAVPAGIYQVRISASDRSSNAPAEALSRSMTSEPFVVDHLAPVVKISLKDKGAAVLVKDELTRLVKAAYALDGGDWVPIFPDDGLFDTSEETITIPLRDLKPGTHVLVIRATDAAGNLGTGDAVFQTP